MQGHRCDQILDWLSDKTLQMQSSVVGMQTWSTDVRLSHLLAPAFARRALLAMTRLQRAHSQVQS